MDLSFRREAGRARARSPRRLAGVLRPGPGPAHDRPPGPARPFAGGVRRGGGGDAGFAAAGRDPRHGRGLVLRHLPSARRLLGLGDRAQGAAAAALAAAAEARTPSRDAAISRLPQADGAAVRRPRPDHGGAVAVRGRRFRATSTRLPRSGSASSTTAWTPSGFRRCAARRTARRCAAAWASTPRRSSC